MFHRAPTVETNTRTVLLKQHLNHLLTRVSEATASDNSDGQPPSSRDPGWFRFRSSEAHRTVSFPQTLLSLAR